MKDPRRSLGFTLIELMIVVAIIGILAAIAVPRFGTLIRKSNEGSTKGNLASIRGALSIYYSDMEGQYPSDPLSLTVSGKYLIAIPISKIPPFHPDSSLITLGMGGGWVDAGGWIYDAVHADATFGSIWAACTHTDTKGSNWTSY